MSSPFLPSTQFLKKHWAGIVIAILVGLIVAGPNLVFTRLSSYRGIPIMPTDNEQYYLARINAAYRGCVMGCNPFIREYGSELPFLDPSIAAAALAIPGHLFSLSTIQLKLSYDFLLPALIAFLMYLLAFRLTGKVLWSLLAALSLVLGFNLFNAQDLINFSDLADLVRLKTDYTGFLLYSRPINPQFSSIVFIIYLHVLLSCIRQKTLSAFVALSAVFALSFYTYFYTYTFLTVVQGVIFLLYLALRAFREARLLLAATTAGILLGLPVLIEIYHYVRHPFYTALPVGGTLHNLHTDTHLPTITAVGILLCISAIAIALRFREKLFVQRSAEGLFFTILVVSSFIILNHQVLTGKIIYPFHYHWYFITPVVLLLFSYVGAKNSGGFLGRSGSWIAWCLGLIFVLNGVVIQVNSYQHWYAYAVSEQSYAAPLTWLTQHARKDSVMMAPETFTRLVSVSTPFRVVWSPYAYIHLYAPDRPTEVLSMQTSPSLFTLYSKKYALDYVITEKIKTNEHAPFTFNIFSYLGERVYVDDRFTIYKVRP